MRIMKDLNDREISAGKNPMSLAATVLYLACIMTGENITQENIANQHTLGRPAFGLVRFEVHCINV